MSSSTPNTAWQEELLRTWHERSGRFSFEKQPKLPNVITILAHHPAWRGVLAWDEFALRMVFAKRPPFHQHDAGAVDIEIGDRVTDEDMTRIGAWLARTNIEIDTITNSCASLNVGSSTVEQAALVVAKKNPFHPVRRYLDSLTWDGAPRVDSWLAHYLGTARNAYTEHVGRWWLISAVARIFEPGCQADHVLTLEGPQGAGKSSALRALGAPWFTDEVPDLTSKDALMAMHGTWIVEFAEFDTLSRSEASRSKAFITARIDRFRLPYSSTVEEFPRACVCAATVNQSAYLKDETGNRRFWPVVCAFEHSIQTEQLALDRDQIWAEAVQLYRAGAEWYPREARLRELLGEEQRERLIEDDWEAPVAEWLRNTWGWGDHDRVSCRAAHELDQRVTSLFEDPSLREAREARAKKFQPCRKCPGCLAREGVTTFQVLTDALKLEPSRIDRGAQMRAGACLIHLGFSKVRGTADGRRMWAYLPPRESVDMAEAAQ